MVGVGDPAMAEKMATGPGRRRGPRALVVHGADGLDELSTTGPLLVYEWDATGAGGVGGPGAGPVAGGVGARTTVDPAALGLRPGPG